MARSANDWAALKKAELEGRELPGTYARLWREHEEELAAKEKKRLEDEFAKAVRLHKEATGSQSNGD
jgi:hypothetical protein